MLKTIVRISLGMIVGMLTLSVMSLTACSKGDTSSPGNDSGLGDQFVSDGGAGATLLINIVGGNRIPVGSTAPFTVTALDPQGNPLAFIQIFCESESGIAIIEPSSGGVAFEMTGADGVMSGIIGALTPGSYVMQCEANNGFGLIDRVSVVNTGDVPPGFAGFPGAAGGNLGGGVIIDDSGTQTVSLSSFTLMRNGEEVSTVDTERGLCLSSSGVCTVEPFGSTSWAIGISNGLLQRIVSASVSFDIKGTASDVGPFSDTITIEPGSSSTITGPFSNGTTFSITGDPVQSGTFATVATVTVTLEDGSTRTSTTTRTITYGAVNSCPSGQSLATVAQCTP